MNDDAGLESSVENRWLDLGEDELAPVPGVWKGERQQQIRRGVPAGNRDSDSAGGHFLRRDLARGDEQRTTAAAERASRVK